MTDDEIKIATNLGTVRTSSGGFDKRFISAISSQARTEPNKELSDKQKEWMLRLVYKYKKQIPKTYDFCKWDPRCSKLISKKP